MGKNVGPPKCRLCQTEHWSHQPHKFEAPFAPKSVSLPTVAQHPLTPDQVAFIKAANNKEDHLKIIAELKAVIAGFEAKEAKRTASAREGMRKKRAADRNPLPAADPVPRVPRDR